jgi:hypothetical protein
MPKQIICSRVTVVATTVTNNGILINTDIGTRLNYTNVTTLRVRTTCIPIHFML